MLRRRLNEAEIENQPRHILIARIGQRNHPRALRLHIAQQLQRLLIAQQRTLFVQVHCRQHHQRNRLAHQRIGPMLQLAAGIPLRM